jgi:hypothetical protein
MCVNFRPVFNSLYLIVMGDFSLSSSIAVSITHLFKSAVNGYLLFKSSILRKSSQNQRLWHSLRSCRFKSKSKSKSIDNAFAMLMLFEKQKHQYFARRHSLKTLSSNLKSKSGFSEGE